MAAEQNQADLAPPNKDVDTSELSNLINEIESLCMNCLQQGTTRLLLTKIPYFRDVVVSSFQCPHCHHRNTEVQATGEIQDKGVQYSFKVETVADLNRNIIKSDHCTAKIEDIGVEIVPGKGQITNVEGLVLKVSDDLSELQEDRKREAPELYEKLEVVIGKIKDLGEGRTLPFTISLDDPTGNSWVEPLPGDSAGKWIKKFYTRSPELNAELGYYLQNQGEQAAPADAAATQPAIEQKVGVPRSVFEQAALKRLHAPLELPRNGEHIRSIGADAGLDLEKQVHEFDTACPNCRKECTSNMTMVDIPFFKEVVLMSLACGHCGYRNNEVKSGGAIPPTGQKITLKVSSPEDLDRSVVKSDSCALRSRELDVAYEPGAAGGTISTVEGILHNIRDEIKKSIFDVSGTTGQGDSMSAETKAVWDAFFARLDAAIEGKFEFTLEFTDPLASTYVERLDKGGEVVDEKLTVEDYVRTREEDEELGLVGMKTEGYENDLTIKEEDEEEEKETEEKKEEAGKDTSTEQTEEAASEAKPEQKSEQTDEPAASA